MQKKIGNNMNTWKRLIQTIRAIIAWLFLTAHIHGQTTSRLSTTFLARGEQALLEVCISGGQPDEVPEIGAIANVTIQPSGRGRQTRILPGRNFEFSFEYLLASYEVGNYVIPPIEVMVNGKKTLTEPLDFQIFNPDELQWSEVEASGKIIRYASSFRAMNGKPFENETTPTEIKIFVPEEMIVDDWGIPDFERDGLAAWRFQPSLMRSRINLLGKRYISVAYPSTITPTRVGKVGIGPAKIRLTTREIVMDPFPRQVNAEVYLQVPKLELESKPLPEGAPEGFENAVGNFRLGVSTAATEVQEGDPISVDLTVSGSGNLDTLHPPTLENATGWKTYGTTTEQRGDERRQLGGSIVFHQSIRPLEMKSEIPPFRLVYFDPKDQSYKTLTTEPTALQMTPNNSSSAPTGIIQTMAVPFERMTDILAVIRTSNLTLPNNKLPPSWLGHVVAAFIALSLAARALWMRYGSRLGSSPLREIQMRELREIETAGSNDEADFLRSAGAFIERRLGGNSSPDVQALLAERDAICFRSDRAKTVLAPSRRREIIKVLRRAALAWIIFAAFISGTPVNAATLSSRALEAYEAAKFDEAVNLWFEAGSYDQLSADTLYNIGNASYRSSDPGQAALYYRRALVRDPSHQEARQNLRFLERKYGAIVIHRPEFQYAITGFSLSTWQWLCWTGLWLCLIGLLIVPATRPGARLRIVAGGTLVIAPILASIGALGWFYFPTDAEFAPLKNQAVIISENVILHTDAARTAPEVIDAPPGSLCEIISESGRWAYVAFTTQTRGWVPANSIEKVISEKTPTPPKFRKPKADGKTA